MLSSRFFASELIGVKLLAERLSRVKLLDASWHMPAAKRNAEGEWQECRIPGARFFDIDKVCDTANPLPHMLPSPAQFAEAMGGMGIARSDPVVLYDSVGIFSSARALWMFKVFGHVDVAVLDGGLPAWKAAGQPVETGAPPPVEPAKYEGVTFDETILRTMHQLLHNVDAKNEQVIDARNSARFKGEVPEPRPHLRVGHIPGAKNVPFSEITTSEGFMRSPEELEQKFTAAGVDLKRPIVTSCASGVSAAVVWLGLKQVHVDASLYDGSWTEWGAESLAGVTPVEK